MILRTACFTLAPRLRTIGQALMAAAGIGFGALSFGASPSTAEIERFNATQYAKDFAGYRGIEFICSYEEDEPLAARACERATVDIKLIAASNRLLLHVVRPNDSGTATFLSATDSNVQLHLDLTSLATDSGQSSIHARLSLVEYYSEAIERDAKPSSLSSMPRSGDLELWAGTTMAMDVSADDVVARSADGIETLAKHAFTLLLRHGNLQRTQTGGAD